MVRSLKEELQLSSNSDFMADAVALFGWAVREWKRGQRFSAKAQPEREVLIVTSFGKSCSWG